MRIYYFILLSILSVTCSAQSLAEKYQSVVDQYCVTCHNDQLKTAGLTLQDVNTRDLGGGAEKWEKVLRKLKVRSMPPSGMPRPDAETYNGFSQFLESGLDDYARANPQPGRAAMRRINRTEYANVIRDLLGVEIEEESLLPPDDIMFGFNNIGNVLTLSPVLTEQYIAAARKVRRQALGDSNIQPVYEIYTLTNNTRQEERLGEDLPFGSRGGIAVQHYFPANGEYEIQVRLQRNSRDYIRGLQDYAHKVDFRLDGKQLDLISIGGEKHGRSSGIFSTASQGDIAQEHYERSADDALYVRFYSEAGYHQVVATFLKDNSIAETPVYPKHTNYDFSQYKGGLPGIRSVSVGGPFNRDGMAETISREMIYSCKPSSINDVKCAESILRKLATRAFRRQPADGEMQELMAFFKRGQSEGSFDEGIGLAVERILAGPEFLFILEEQPGSLAEGETFKISPNELVTKLALFIWSSFPDDELLALAGSGKIQNSKVLNQQAQRMLNDPRADALLNNFALQWLNLGRLNAVAPDTELFPYFDDNLRAAFKKETELFVDYIIKQDRPLLEMGWPDGAGQHTHHYFLCKPDITGDSG